MSLCESLASVAGGEFTGKMCLGGRGVQTGRPGSRGQMQAAAERSPVLPSSVALTQCVQHIPSQVKPGYSCAVLPRVT